MTLAIPSTMLAAAGLSALALTARPATHADAAVLQSAAQDARQDDLRPLLRMTAPARGAYAYIGASIDDLRPADAERMKVQGGAVVQDVTSDGPAAKAGLRRNDVIVEFDGERVRSARQLSRLVQESTPDRTVTAKIVRDGRNVDMSLTPAAPAQTDLLPGDALRDSLGDLRRLPRDLENLPFGLSGPQLGISVQELTPELAAYFGAKAGVLVASVAESSAAARAGLKVGDVITTVNGQSIDSRGDLMAAIRRAGPNAQLSLGIVRDKKESSLSAQLPDDRARARNRPRRTI